jgi:hypothetical protein
MTVRDLIKKLQTLPQDYVVIMDNGSDYYPFGRMRTTLVLSQHPRR